MGPLLKEGASLHRVDGHTAVFCVLGHPIGHTLSPAMQNAALAAMGINGAYVAFDVAPEALPDAVRGLRTLGVRGVNCTIPLKEVILPLVDELSAEAQFIGAVNTLVFADGKVTGHNTDAPGFLAALRAQGVDPLARPAVVLGAGGSARAIAAALARRGVPVAVVNRTWVRAEGLATEFNERLGEQRVRPIAETDEEGVAAALLAAGLLVNTTSLGMAPAVDAMPRVPLGALHSELFVYDLIYNPLETRLLREARARGVPGTHGAGMLAHQGALALELWTGRPAPAALMEQVVLETLSARTVDRMG